VLVVATASGAFHNGPGLGHRTPPTLVTRAHVAHAQWTTWAVRAMGGASESLSHTSGAWPTLPPVCARPKVLG
jgi:hypothetical protein